MSALYNSELATDQPKLAQLVNWQISDVITNNFDGSSEIQSFNKYVLSGYPSLGEALCNGIINSKKFLSLMDESEKFRGWISNIPQNEGALVSEYIKELSNKTLADNNISKVIRYVVTQIFSFIPVVGNLISAADTFYVEKLLKGWKPNQFINDKLIAAIGHHRTL